MESDGGATPRYVAVRLRHRSFNLSAGVEDRERGELIQVANASMAIRLAGWLNDESEGRPLPDRGPQHVPIRYQLAHYMSPKGPTSVLFAHRSNVRVVAWAERDEVARHIQSILLRVDYPTDELGLLQGAKAHDFGDSLDQLPSQTLELTKADLRPRWRQILASVIGSWVPLLGFAALAGYAFGWLWVGAAAALGAICVWVMGRSFRQ